MADNVTGPSVADPGVDSPLQPSEEHEQRIRERAYHMWEAEGRPHDRDVEFWERARALDAIESSAGAGQVPVDRAERPDEAAIEDNLGEFPDRLSDQGERRTAPMTRPQARAAARSR